MFALYTVRAKHRARLQHIALELLQASTLRESELLLLKSKLDILQQPGACFVGVHNGEQRIFQQEPGWMAAEATDGSNVSFSVEEGHGILTVQRKTLPLWIGWYKTEPTELVMVHTDRIVMPYAVDRCDCLFDACLRTWLVPENCTVFCDPMAHTTRIMDDGFETET